MIMARDRYPRFLGRPADQKVTGGETLHLTDTDGQPVEISVGDMLGDVGLVALKSGYPSLSAAVRKVLTRTGRARIAMTGDSTVAGFGSGAATGTGGGSTPGSGGNYLRANSMPKQLSDLFNANGIPSRADALIGSGTTNNTVAEFNVADPGNTFGGGWTLPFSGSFGGWSFRGDNSGTTSFATRKWDYAADTFDIYYVCGAGTGTFTVTDASGTLATVDSSVFTPPAGATQGALGRVTVRRDAASKAGISIQRTTSGTVAIVAIIPYDSNNPRLEIWNFGWPGAKTSDWSNPYDGSFAYLALTQIDPADAWYVELGLNDKATSVAVGTYQTNYSTLVTKLRTLGGDIFMSKPHHPYLDNATWLLDSTYLAAIDAVALASGANIVDYFNKVSLVQADYYDVPHLSKQGYGKKAAYLFGQIMASL
jgi:lysophospholipase L1-like esterase